MMSSIFFDGSVEEAVNTALRGQKYLVAFLTDEKDESIAWESDYLPAIGPMLSENAVTLRLIAGSQEAEYMASLFPIPKFPTVILIHQGQLKEYLAPGIAKQDFILLANRAFSQSHQPPAEAEAEATASQRGNRQDTNSDNPEMDSETVNQMNAYRAAAAERERTRIQAQEEADAVRRRADAEQQRATERRLAEEARARLARVQAEEQQRLEECRQEALSRRAEAQEKARKAREEGDNRRKAAAEQAARNRKERVVTLTPAERKYRDEVLRKKHDAAEERKRIMAQIESERQDRRLREDGHRMNLRDIKRIEAEHAAAEAQVIDKQKRLLGVASPDGTTCAIQVRLMDGTLVRARFGGGSTVKRDVREWVGEKMLEEDRQLRKLPAFRLKMIMTPKPTVNIERGDEEKTVIELGMAPSTTLVVVHDDGNNDGEDGGGKRSIFFGLWVFGMFILSLWSGLISLFTRSEQSRSSGSDERARQVEETAASPDNTEGTKGKSTGVDTADSNDGRRRQEQYYNGNSTAFESRPEDEGQELEWEA